MLHKDCLWVGLISTRYAQHSKLGSPLQAPEDKLKEVIDCIIFSHLKARYPAN